MKKNIFIIGILCLLVTATNVYAADCAILGPNVTKDVLNILKALQSLGPVLVLAYTTYEVVKEIGCGELQKEAKKMAKKFMKRCIYAILLFFVPVLVNQIAQLAGIWSEDSCDLTGYKIIEKI